MVYICDYESDPDVEILPGPPPCFQTPVLSPSRMRGVPEAPDAPLPPIEEGSGGSCHNDLRETLANLHARCGAILSDGSEAMSESESELSFVVTDSSDSSMMGCRTNSSSDSSGGRSMASRTFQSKASKLTIPEGLVGVDSRYDWVDREVLGIASDFPYGTPLNVQMVKKGVSGITVSVPRRAERVCLDLMAEKKDGYSFYFYEGISRRVGVRLPLGEWYVLVLEYLRVAPTQLTPNSWGFIRAFEALCKVAGFPCTLRMFFWMFKVGHRTNTDEEKEGRHGRTSLQARPKRGILAPFFSNEKS
ncbi:unnamed protein product [Lupinus luteus]|uniref:Transposase (putative) gypsy type domain-containing protein n=1 Tax=Lupinus luteus TaxID=3873 RepID=A0AAV1Y6J2_LUPLU